MLNFLKKLLFGDKSSSKTLNKPPLSSVIEVTQSLPTDRVLEETRENQLTIKRSPENPSNLSTNKAIKINENPPNLQTIINQLSANETLTLSPPFAEYQAPIIIEQPIIIEGQGATLWSKKGAVIMIRSDNICLQNLRIEITGENSDNLGENCAILVESGQNLQFKNVEIKGNIMGIPEEEGQWYYPETLNLGQLTAKQEHQLILRLIVPINCKIISDISGLTLTPNQLKSGVNEITINLESLPELFLQGELWLVSPNFKRRISLTAQIVNHAPPTNQIIWQPQQWLNSLKYPAQPASLTEAIIPISQPIKSTSIPKIQHNQTPDQQSWLINDTQSVISSQKPEIRSEFQETEKIAISNIKTNSIPLISTDIFCESEITQTDTQSHSKVNKPSIPDIFQ
jgi:hypothetical protein